jgi:hypothetical protein
MHLHAYAKLGRTPGYASGRMCNSRRTRTAARKATSDQRRSRRPWLGSFGRDLPAQDLKLLAQRRQLDVFHVRAATAANKRTEQSAPLPRVATRRALLLPRRGNPRLPRRSRPRREPRLHPHPICTPPAASSRKRHSAHPSSSVASPHHL